MRGHATGTKALARRPPVATPRAPTLPPRAAPGWSGLDLGENGEGQGRTVQQNDPALDVRDLDAEDGAPGHRGDDVLLLRGQVGARGQRVTRGILGWAG